MRVKSFLGRKTAAVVLMMAVVGLGLTACLPPPPPAPAAAPGDTMTTDLYNALNQDRASAGLPALSWNSQLASNASGWAVQMKNANALYHQNLGALLYSPSYSPFFTLGENIIVGPGSMSAGTIEASWRNSAPHWANITNRSFNTVGIGYVRGPDGRIWAVQEFGGL
jgi:uncharacterized protein YkwD